MVAVSVVEGFTDECGQILKCCEPYREPNDVAEGPCQARNRRPRGNLKDITDYLEEQRGYDICDYLMKDRECLKDRVLQELP